MRTFDEVANAINKFKYNKEVTSPPHQTPEQKTIRDLTIIDMTNCIADQIAQQESSFDREAFLTKALRSRP